MQTKIDVFSGFLGAGKTTLIKKLIKEAFTGEQIVIIENEFGEIGIDGCFLQDAGITVTEMNSGCICCSLVGDFGEALTKVIETYHPDRIIIEPSGVGKLSDVIKAVRDLQLPDVLLNSFTTVADATKIKVYMKNFGEFYNNQIAFANCLVLSRSQLVKEDKLEGLIALLREQNPHATVVTTPWDAIDGSAILSAMEHTDSLFDEWQALAGQEAEKHHHHHDEDCECHHHHDNDDNEHEHHHHDHDEDCECHHHHDEEHEHHHHDGHCCCGHHHSHDADEVFTSWGKETVHRFSKETLHTALSAFDSESTYGTILRAKGIVEGEDGNWIHFDYVPGQVDVRTGSAATIGRLCVIGSGLNEEKLTELFGL